MDKWQKLKLILSIGIIVLVIATIALVLNLSNSINTQIAAENSGQDVATSNEEESTMANINIIIGEQTFTATLVDNDTARAFLEQLPLTVEMSDLNANEKYYYFSTNLPAAASSVGTIEAGDLMLYGKNCLVLFYETFQTGYSYTRIGKISDPSGLAEAVGDGTVTVTFTEVEA